MRPYLKRGVVESENTIPTPSSLISVIVGITMARMNDKANYRAWSYRIIAKAMIQFFPILY